MAGPVPPAIVLALGAGALGAPDALRLLLQFAGRGPAVDVAICLAVISIFAAHLLGTMLLVRFVREARAGGGSAPVTNLLAQVTATMSACAALLVTACLIVAPGGLASVRVPVDFAVNSPTAAVLGVGAIFSVPCAAPLLLCFFRGAGTGSSAGGLASVRVPVDFAVNSPTVSVPSAAPLLLRFFRGAGTGSSAGGPAAASKVAYLVAWSLVAVCLAAYAHLLIPDLPWSWFIDMPVDVAIGITTVAGTALLVWCSHRARHVTAAAGADASGRRLPQLVAIACRPPKLEPFDGEHACPVLVADRGSIHN